MLRKPVGDRQFVTILANPSSKTTLETYYRATVFGVRRDKAALFQWVKAPPGNPLQPEAPEQLWR